jgi:hypothetical protein
MAFDVTVHHGIGRDSNLYADTHEAWKVARETPGYRRPPAKIAERAAKAALLHFLGRKRMPRKLLTTITSGNRYNNVVGRNLIINPSRGWENLVHELSHYTWWRLHPEASPHDPGHAGHELRWTKFVIDKGFPFLADPPAKPKPTRAQKRAARVERVNELLAAWSRKRKWADTAIHKLTMERSRLVREALREATTEETK